MLGRRLLVFAAVLLGLGVLAASVVPRELSPPAEPPASPPAPVVPSGPPEATAATPTPAAGDVPGEPRLRRIDSARSFKPIPLRVGERVRLAFSGARVSAVQVGRDGPIEAIDPISPARFDLLYSTPGRREVRLYGPALSNPRVIGALEVEPAA